jgi:hypothetical protein
MILGNRNNGVKHGRETEHSGQGGDSRKDGANTMLGTVIEPQ